MTKVDITHQASALVEALKSIPIASLNGLSIPCSPQAMHQALKNPQNPRIPADIGKWINSCLRGLSSLAGTVGRNPDATLAPESADTLVREWLSTGAVLNRCESLLQCLQTLVEGTLKLDPQKGADASGVAEMLGALRSVPHPSWSALSPRPVSPASGSSFSNFPRSVTVRWQRLPLAVAYSVHVEYCEDPRCTSSRPLIAQRVTATEFTFDFVGKQTGRWRVAGLDSAGGSSAWSSWSEFVYTV